MLFCSAAKVEPMVLKMKIDQIVLIALIHFSKVLCSHNMDTNYRIQTSGINP